MDCNQTSVSSRGCFWLKSLCCLCDLLFQCLFLPQCGFLHNTSFDILLYRWYYIFLGNQGAFQSITLEGVAENRYIIIIWGSKVRKIGIGNDCFIRVFWVQVYVLLEYFQLSHVYINVWASDYSLIQTFLKSNIFKIVWEQRGSDNQGSTVTR